MQLKDKTALITGATRGIGAAILREIAAAGARVIGTATTQAGADQISADLEKAGLDGMGVLMNINETTAVESALEKITQRYNTMPHILINNAGITQDNLFLRMKESEWDSVINTNLNSIYRVTKACLKSMLKERWGRIISISSLVGLAGNPGQCNYAATKAGIIGFSKSLALEVASRNITVNVVAPGLVDTNMAERLNEQQRESLLAKIPMGRLGLPSEIAAGVVFLASPQAAYITGETLSINGGMYMS